MDEPRDELRDEKDLPEEETDLTEEGAEDAPEEDAVDPAKELEQLQDRYQRMLAEYSNYKRRSVQEKQQLSEYIKAELLTALLPVLDTMDRAVSAPDGDDYRAGMEKTARQLHDLLAQQGLQEIEAQDKPFDPELHHCVSREDSEDDGETVIEVYQKGYKAGSRVIRPAMVKVAN